MYPALPQAKGDPMISKKIEKALNDQIQRELHSGYVYLSMSAYSQQINLKGFAQWMRLQSAEERGHALRLFDYLIDCGGTVALQSIEKPPQTFKSARQMFEVALESEQEITRQIHRIYKLAKDESDYATEVELQWFIREQVEEENTTEEILNRLKLVGNQPAGLYMIDRELGARQQSGH